MKRSSLNIAGMLLVLTVGMAVGALVFRDLPHANAASDRPVAPMDAPPPVIPAPIDTRHSEDARQLGVIFARQSADIVALSEGELQAVHSNLGQRLKAGDVIAEIDSYSITQQLEMAEAMLRSAQAEQRDVELELEDAAIRYHRREQLAQEGLISMEDLATAKVHFDRVEAKLDAVQARVAEQIAHVNDVKRSVAKTVIKAPFDGTVAARYIDPGAVVRFGTAIISLTRPEDLWVRFTLAENQQHPLGIGTIVEFELEGSSVSVPGTIEYVAPSITASSQELLVEARLQVSAALRDQIRPGSIGRVSRRAR